jgi:tetratricopeptide (TPR) repeat protein
MTDSADTFADVQAAADRKRARRRIILLLVSLPVVIAAVVVAVKLISLSVTAQAAIIDYNTGNYESSIDRSTSLLELNVIEPYIPYFNRGDAQAGREYYVDAVEDFEKALELAPQAKKCDVRVNLALSWELLGDIYAEGGYFEGAVLLYEAAEAVITAGGEDCEPPTQSSDELSEAQERVEGKKDIAEAQRDAAEAQEEGKSTQQKLDELGERGEQGSAEKENGDSLDRGEGQGDGTYTDKPW